MAIALSAACSRHNISPQTMLAAVAECLDIGADRRDSWKGTMAQRLLDLVQATEGKR